MPSLRQSGIVDRLGTMMGLVAAGQEHSRQPIDLNFIAIPKDIWERLVALAELEERDRA